jgi:hypothetical protein
MVWVNQFLVSRWLHQPVLPVMILNINIENRMKSSATEMIEEPLMIPSQPPIFAENKHWLNFIAQA